MNLALLAALNAHGVEIPFPQRVVRLRPDESGDAAPPITASLRPAQG
jgi:small-conductance mechanosensitive channel